MDQIAVLLAPGHVPDELGGSYEDACAALELPPVPGGYALYLLDQMNQRQTLISTDATAVRQAELACRNGDGDGHPDTVGITVADVIGVREGWPEEYGGGPRCQFCRAPDPAWVYEGADVEVLLGEPLLGFKGEPLPVVGSEVVGCTDWHACSACHDLIEAADLAAWLSLLDRYGDPDVPMPVQSAWREFWVNHRPPEPAAPPEWTPGRRRRVAYELAARWDDIIATLPINDVRFTDDTDVPELAGADAALDAARAYLQQPPPAGRIRIYPAGGDATIVRADGDGWSLVGRTGSVSFMLLDTDPNTLHAIGWKASPSLLDELSHLAPNL
jgi:hypothetical protein